MWIWYLILIKTSVILWWMTSFSIIVSLCCQCTILSAALSAVCSRTGLPRKSRTNRNGGCLVRSIWSYYLKYDTTFNKCFFVLWGNKWPSSSPLSHHTAEQMSEQLQVLKESRADPQVQFVTHRDSQVALSAGSWAAFIVYWAAGGLTYRAYNWQW